MREPRSGEHREDSHGSLMRRKVKKNLRDQGNCLFDLSYFVYRAKEWSEDPAEVLLQEIMASDSVFIHDRKPCQVRKVGSNH